MKKIFLVLFSIVFINSANAGDLSKKDMEKAKNEPEESYSLD